MNLNELQTLIKTGEGYTIEFKESVNSSIGKENTTSLRHQHRTNKIPGELELKLLLKDLNVGWSEKWSEKWSELTKRRKQILILIIKNPNITRTELSEKIGINPSAIQKHLDILKEKEIIIREGPDKGGYWKIIGK